MKEPNKIPEMTHPFGVHWNQPNRDEIEISTNLCLMSKDAFDKLKNYPLSDPSGVYVGKMWKRETKNEDGKSVWYLCWYDYHETPDYCSTETRKILIKP